MTICRFWKTGTCRYGDQCKNEHPPGVGPQAQNQFKSQPQNRFGAFDRPPNQNHQGNNQGFATQNGRNPPTGPNSRDNRAIRDSYGVTPEVLEEDLRERPMWIMSSYGPGKNPPIQLFGGPTLEQSPEEIRTLHYIALAAGNPQQSAALEAELAEKANGHLQMAMGDIQGALKYMREGEREHPNRKDICHQLTTHHEHDGDFSRERRRRAMREAQPRAPRPGFGAAAGNGNQSAGFGRSQSPAPNAGFGGGMSGAMATQPQPGFGQQPQQNGFGQQPSGFGAPSGGIGQQQQSGPFDPHPPPAAPSGFGGSGMQGSGFGQANVQKENAGFGGQAMQQSNGFGGGVGQQATGFGQQPLGGGQQTSGFGQQSSGFGGQSLNPQPNGFPGPQVNGMAPQQSSSGIERPGPNHVNNGQNAPKTNGATSLPNATGDLSTYTTRNADGRLTSWKGKPVQYDKESNPCYAGQGGALERIWFPNGPPTTEKVNTMKKTDYSEEVISQYQAFRDSGLFPGDTIPSLPPKVDMTRYDV